MRVDLICPLYNADNYIDNLIFSLQNQDDVQLNVIFPITEIGDTSEIKKKILETGYSYFTVSKEEFSHSLTREKAVFEYCNSDVVVMMSQDVGLIDSHAIYTLAKAINNEVVYAYGRQICKRKNIEKYIREKNYPSESSIVSKDDIDKLQLKAFFASDAFSAYQRPTFIKLNGYDNVHMMMSEDMYYAKKILEAGYKKAYVAEAVVEHSHKFTFKQLYNRYFETGKWFAEHPEFDNYKTTDAGFNLALYVLGQSLAHFNLPALVRWLPDMALRYLGMKKGRKSLNKR
jgi:rhamnosyltransferase